MIWYLLIGTMTTLYFLHGPSPGGYTSKQDVWMSILCGVIWPVTFVITFLIIMGYLKDDGN